MKILNFSHPLTAKQMEQISTLLGETSLDVRDVKVQFDVSQDFVPQIVSLVDGLEISPEGWQKESWLILLPSLNYGAGVLLAELHGRMGHFPAILRLRSMANSLVTEFEVAEIINLENVRQVARTRR